MLKLNSLLAFIIISNLLLAQQNLSDIQSDSIRAENAYNAGRVLTRTGDYKESLDSFLLSLNIKKRILGEDNSGLTRYLLAVGIAYKNLGFSDLSIEYYKATENIYMKTLGENHFRIADLYVNIGNVYKNKINYFDAIRYFEKAISIYKNQKIVDKSKIAGTYYNIAQTYNELDNYDEVLKICMRYLSDATEEDKLKYYDLLGEIYAKQKNYPDAIKYYKKAEELTIKLYSAQDIDVAYVYLKLAFVFITINQNEQATSVMDKAYKIITFYNEEKGTYIADYYLRMSQLMENKHIESRDLLTFKNQKSNNLTESIEWDKKALEALNFPEFLSEEINWNEIYLISKITCLETLKSIADKYVQIVSIYENDKIKNYGKSLTDAIDYYKVTISLLQWAKKEISDDESKIQLAGLEQSTYLKSIQACYKAYELTKNFDFLNLAFNNAEQLKSGSIFEKLSDQFARENSLIPDSLNQKLQILNSKITRLSEIVYNESVSENPDQEIITKTDSSLFQLKKQRTELNDYLANNYSDYYNLKYSDASVSLKNIQENLKGNEAFIEYILNENDSVPELYAFLLTRNQVKFIKQNIDNKFINDIETVFHFTSNSGYMFTKNNDSKQFCVASNELYKKLIAPFRYEIADKKIIIIPDGKLNYIAFDGLIENLPDTSKTINFGEQDYLLIKNCINYSYSGNLLYGVKHSNRKLNKNLLAFAPIYNGDTITLENQKLILTPLPGIQKEVDLISKEIKSNLFKGVEANEKNFRSFAEKYDILHLAMHAFINDSLPAFSSFAFSQNGDESAESDGLLKTADIYNLNLNARLTVLSACNTGTGTLKKGEGVMSLARGFLYAGCPSIVMTLWEVEDNSGTQIMNTFYKYLKKGKSKDEALRLAKLEYLTHANPLQSHPHYWLGYVSIGDNSNMFLSYDYYFFSLLFLALAGIISEQLIRIKKARKKRAYVG